jgi:hypothetical protein
VPTVHMRLLASAEPASFAATAKSSVAFLCS